mmetsp:Transcript_35516/g.115652  ORF Transcript_35516/g.115652 Transcript_35516/m.115652 type:complete len:154 (-) Transcript_35516:138-599(-)
MGKAAMTVVVVVRAAMAVVVAVEAEEAEERGRRAEQLKTDGNAAFREARYAEAVRLYSAAVELEPENGVLFSNRSGALTALASYDLALADADRCTALRPDWPKGFARRAAALHGLRRFALAVNAYDAALALDPSDGILVTARRQSSFALAIET